MVSGCDIFLQANQETVYETAARLLFMAVRFI